VALHQESRPWESHWLDPPPGVARVSGVVGKERGREFGVLGRESEEERWSG